MVDVDDVWAEMQRDSALCRSSRPARRTPAANKPFDLSALQREKPRQKAKPAKKLDASLKWMHSWNASIKTATDVPGVTGETVGTFEQTEPPSTLLDVLEDIPSETPETFLAYIQRDVNCLGEDCQGVRLQSLLKLERVLVYRIDSLSTDVIDASLDALLKPLLKRAKDKSEKCRELSIRILRSLVDSCSDLSAALAYVFPVLVSRLGCEDLDGVAHLPEVMRPAPEQKPTEITRPVEDSEEVRLELAFFVKSLLGRCNQTQILCYIDEATGLLRAQAMDMYQEVKAVALETLISFCYNHTEMLLHFAEPLGRSLCSCLMHQHARIRIKALQALTAVLFCGVWKHNHEIFQVLMAWQDPNSVPIKAFYESVTKVNYLSTLSFDRHPAVRRFWYETMSYWLLRLPDKVDNEPYIFPYLLTGLCDENEEIALETFWLIEKCGALYETEHETDLRKTKQYGFDYGWTYGGRAFVPFPLQGLWAGGGVTEDARRVAAHGPDMMGQVPLKAHHHRDGRTVAPEDSTADTPNITDITDMGEECVVPPRDYAWPELADLGVFKRLPRPRLGSRCWVRTHTRRYIKATFNDVVDFRDCTALNAGRLLCMSLAYSEEGITEFLQPMYASLCKFYSGRSWAAGNAKAQVTETYDTVCKLLGAFLDPRSYWEQLRGALDCESSLEMDQRVASVRILALCLEGSVKTLQSVMPPDPELGLGRLTPIFSELISYIHASDLLLVPSDDSRAAMWKLLDAFLEPLQEHLSREQIGQLLFATMSLASKPPPDACSELAGQSIGEALQFEEQEWLDFDRLQNVLRILSDCSGSDEAEVDEVDSVAVAPAFSLDSLDDDPIPQEVDLKFKPPSRADPRSPHHRLFKLAIGEILSRVEDSFQILRSVVFSSPLSVLLSGDSANLVLERLAHFSGPRSSSVIRMSCQALGVHFALRCAKFAASEVSAEAVEARGLIHRICQALCQAQVDAGLKQGLSYGVIASGASLWRRFFMHPQVNPRDAIFPSEIGGPSSFLQWLVSVLADQELYKKMHLTLQKLESLHAGKNEADFTVLKSKEIREVAEERANIARGLAASTLLLAIRGVFHECGQIPWAEGNRPGSLRKTFLAVGSLFRPAEPSMDPPFVKPTPPSLVLYAAVLLRLLLRQGSSNLPAPFKLRDDAARAIHEICAPQDVPTLPFAMEPNECEALVEGWMSALMELNLSLPPDPAQLNAPGFSEETHDAIVVGGEYFSGAADADAANSPTTTTVPAEVSHIMHQSVEHLRWNAALALYELGGELSYLCPEAFQACIFRYKRRKEQGRLLVIGDVMERAKRKPKSSVEVR